MSPARPRIAEESRAQIDQNPDGYRYAVDCAWTDADGRRAGAAAASTSGARSTPSTRSRSGTAGHPSATLPDMAFSVEGNVYVATYLIYPDAADDEKYRDAGARADRGDRAPTVASASTSATPTSPGGRTGSSATRTSGGCRTIRAAARPGRPVRLLPRRATRQAERACLTTPSRPRRAIGRGPRGVRAVVRRRVRLRARARAADRRDRPRHRHAHPSRARRPARAAPPARLGTRSASGEPAEAALTQGFGHLAFDVPMSTRTSTGPVGPGPGP